MCCGVAATVEEEGRAIACATALTGSKCGNKTTPRGFEPLRAEPNGFRVHLLSRSDTVSCDGTLSNWHHAAILEMLRFVGSADCKPLAALSLNFVFSMAWPICGRDTTFRKGAASEDRTHDLRIMRPMRCQLRYRRCSCLETTLESHAPAASTCKGQSTLLLPIALNCPTCCHERHFAFAADAKNMEMTAVGFEPTPFRTGAWSQRLRPLGQPVSATLLGHPGQKTPSRHAACHVEERACQGQ